MCVSCVCLCVFVCVFVCVLVCVFVCVLVCVFVCGPPQNLTTVSHFSVFRAFRRGETLEKR